MIIIFSDIYTRWFSKFHFSEYEELFNKAFYAHKIYILFLPTILCILMENFCDIYLVMSAGNDSNDDFEFSSNGCLTVKIWHRLILPLVLHINEDEMKVMLMFCFFNKTLQKMILNATLFMHLDYFTCLLCVSSYHIYRHEAQLILFNSVISFSC